MMSFPKRFADFTPVTFTVFNTQRFGWVQGTVKLQDGSVVCVIQCMNKDTFMIDQENQNLQVLEKPNTKPQMPLVPDPAR